MRLNRGKSNSLTPSRRPQESQSRLAYDGFGMIDRLQAPVNLPIALSERLSAEDDPALWGQVLAALAKDASTLEAVNDGSQLYAEVGVCSHWLRPHQTRWTAAGGFAYPIGYGDGEGFAPGIAGLPRFDWSVRLQFSPASVGWVIPVELPTKRFNSVRVAVPSRTARHRQAAVHALWSPRTLDAKHKRTVFYGFRSLNGVWELKARSKER